MLVNIKKRLKVWRDHGLISESEVHNILAFEDSPANRSWISFGVAGIGVTTLATGVVSLIASNWDYFNDSLKLAAYFILQIGLGIAFLRFEKKEGLVRESLLALFALLFWAGIGLFSQIYNLSGPPHQAMLLWVCLTLPATLYSNSRLLCSIWCFTVGMTGIFWDSPTNSNHYLAAATTTFMLLTTFGIGTHSVGLIRDPLRSASIFWGIGFLLAVITPYINVIWIAPHELVRALAGAHPSIIGPWCAIALAVAVSLLRPNIPPLVKKMTATLFVTTGAYYSSMLLADPQLPHWVGQLCGALGFIAVWSVAAAAAAAASMKRLFDIASFVIAVRFIVIYFEVFGDLSTTGIGLIVSGAVILAVAFIWNRGRQTVTTKLGGNV